MGDGGVGGGGESERWGARAGGLIGMRLLHDIYSCCVSRNAPVSRRGLIVSCRDLPIICFLSNFWGSAILRKLNTETCVYRY